MSERQGKPVIGRDAAGADTYVTVIASAATTERKYTHIVASVSTYGATLSFDGGTTESVDVPAGGGVGMDDVEITGAVQAKNETAGSNYTKLSISVW